MAKEAIKQLRHEGIEVSLDDIVTLHSLASQTDKISDPNALLFCSKDIGGIEIFPMTIGARLWILQSALPWFEHDELLKDLSVLYAYCHSRNKNDFQFSRAKDARKTILSWAKDLRVTEEEIVSAFTEISGETPIIECMELLQNLVEQIKSDPLKIDLSKATKYLNRGNEISNGKEAYNINGYIALLMHYYPGKSVGDWLWETSENCVLEMIKKMNSFEQDENKVDPHDPALLALHAFSIEVRRIKGRGGICQTK